MDASGGTRIGQGLRVGDNTVTERRRLDGFDTKLDGFDMKVPPREHFFRKRVPSSPQYYRELQ